MDAIKCGKYSITVTNIDRILFPKSKIKKADFITYHYKIAKTMLPYMEDHPLTMHRFPDGIKGEGFYQKNAADYFPKWIKTFGVKNKDGSTTKYVICNNQATLVYLANQVCTLHLWLSKIPRVKYPDRMIFDLDPAKSSIPFSEICRQALHLKELLEKLRLKSFAMATGSRGIHVIVPLNGRYDFDTVSECAYAIAELMVEADPDNLTLEIRKAKRGARIFIDTLRNGFGATAVAPYSVRSIEGAPVATPLEWHELKDKKLTAQKYTIKNIFNRLKSVGDPLKGMLKTKNNLAYALKALNQK